MLHREDGFPGGVVHRREAAFQRAADHGGDQLVHVGVLGILGHDQVAVTQHRDLVADLKDLIHLMRDIDQRDALRFQHPHHFEELVDLLHGQGGGGLVQNDDLRVVGDGFRDLAHLTLGNRHIPHGLGQVHGHTEFAEQLGGLFLHSSLVNNAGGIDRIAAKEQVIDDVAFQALVQLLVDHGNAVFQGIFGPGKADLLAVEEDLAFVLLVGAKQALHHRGLTGAVFAHKSHDSSALDVEVDMVKNPVATEGLGHTTN